MFTLYTWLKQKYFKKPETTIKNIASNIADEVMLEVAWPLALWIDVCITLVVMFVWIAFF